VLYLHVVVEMMYRATSPHSLTTNYLRYIKKIQEPKIDILMTLFVGNYTKVPCCY